jgi:hypothetical protein
MSDPLQRRTASVFDMVRHHLAERFTRHFAPCSSSVVVALVVAMADIRREPVVVLKAHEVKQRLCNMLTSALKARSILDDFLVSSVIYNHT